MQRKPTQPQSPPEYLRLADVRKRYRVSASTIWRWVSDTSTGFPQPIRLSPGVTVWSLSALQAWEEARATQGAAK